MRKWQKRKKHGTVISESSKGQQENNTRTIPKGYSLVHNTIMQIMNRIKFSKRFGKDEFDGFLVCFNCRVS